MSKKNIIILILIALFLKSFLFFLSESTAPKLKFRPDTQGYLKSGITLAEKGVFGEENPNGSFSYQYYRTPGYPLFLGIFHKWFKIPLSGMIFIQILLTIAAALITLAAANKINPQLGKISFIIMLFDPSIALYSLMLLTETLFLFVMSVFLYTMVLYLKNKETKHLLLSALLLTTATYIRPIGIYLGVAIGAFIFFTTCRKNLKKSLFHAGIFMITIYCLIFAWQWRNYNHFHEYRFSNIGNATVNLKGLYKSYERNEDPYSQNLSPIPYYINVSSRCLMSLFTRPASYKYFDSKPVKRIGKAVAYPWILFWITGLAAGSIKIGKNISFHFLLLVILYFSATTVVGAMWGADARFRMPMMPYIAILSAYGWQSFLKKHS